MTDTKNIIFYR